MDPTLMASLKIFRRSFIFLLLSSSILYTQSFMTTNNANDIFRKMCYFKTVCKNAFTMRQNGRSKFISRALLDSYIECYRNMAGVLSKSSEDNDLNLFLTFAKSLQFYHGH